MGEPLALRPLGETGIWISPLGLGTVKLGRNQQVKYPHPFTLPDDRSVIRLLESARALGINLLDTAPAYGNSMERLGRLLPGRREEWVIFSKVGESFRDGRSHFDFSFQHTLESVEKSLRTLRSDYLDGVVIHSDGNDCALFDPSRAGVVAALQELKQRGLIRSHGLSGKSVAGGLLALEQLDWVMVTCNLHYNDELEVLQQAQRRNQGVLIKKALASGHLGSADAPQQRIAEALRFVYAQPAVSSILIGTINPQHLRDNVAILQQIIAQQGCPS